MVAHSGLCALPGIRAGACQYLVHSRLIAYRGGDRSSTCAAVIQEFRIMRVGMCPASASQLRAQTFPVFVYATSAPPISFGFSMVVESQAVLSS